MSIRDRLNEAEATLEAIRTGRVDAVVVRGPEGEQTRIFQGATHPYYVLLNAMSDGAVLLDSTGEILFGNSSFGEIVRAPLDKLRGTLFQRLMPASERATLVDLIRSERPEGKAREFTLRTGAGTTTPVAIALSTLPVGTYHGLMDSEPRDSVVLMGIIMDLTHTKAAEAARAELLRRLISAEDDERRRVALELHDETGQSLTALLVGLRAMADMSAPPAIRSIALRLRDIAAQLTDEVGRLARGLHPLVLDEAGLEAAATRYIADYVESFGTPVEFTAGDLCSPRLPSLVAASAYRILQEALTNVARHARARRIQVLLTRDESSIRVVVRDDGVGFSDRRAPAAGSGLGLRGMRERIMLLGGSLRIESKRGDGTVVRARIPIEAGATDGREADRRPRRVRETPRS